MAPPRTARSLSIVKPLSQRFRTNDAPGWRRPSLKGGFALLGLALLAGGVAGLLAYRGDARYDRLMESGIAVDGTITSVEPNGRGSELVFYRYAVGGRDYLGEVAGSIDLKQGQRITVVADRDDPSDATVIGQLAQSRVAYTATCLLAFGAVYVAAVGAAEVWRNLPHKTT